MPRISELDVINRVLFGAYYPNLELSIQDAEERQQKKKQEEKAKHLNDIEILNQNARGK
jgi:hypothetical protein